MPMQHTVQVAHEPSLLRIVGVQTPTAAIQASDATAFGIAQYQINHHGLPIEIQDEPVGEPLVALKDTTGDLPHAVLQPCEIVEHSQKILATCLLIACNSDARAQALGSSNVRATAVREVLPHLFQRLA